jgi:hypothetical protein
MEKLYRLIQNINKAGEISKVFVYVLEAL